jgi:hypothetical protein
VLKNRSRYPSIAEFHPFATNSPVHHADHAALHSLSHIRTPLSYYSFHNKKNASIAPFAFSATSRSDNLYTLTMQILFPPRTSDLTYFYHIMALPHRALVSIVCQDSTSKLSNTYELIILLFSGLTIANAKKIKVSKYYNYSVQVDEVKGCS